MEIGKPESKGELSNMKFNYQVQRITFSTHSKWVPKVALRLPTTKAKWWMEGELQSGVTMEIKID